MTKAVEDALHKVRYRRQGTLPPSGHIQEQIAAHATGRKHPPAGQDLCKPASRLHGRDTNAHSCLCIRKPSALLLSVCAHGKRGLRRRVCVRAQAPEVVSAEPVLRLPSEPRASLPQVLEKLEAMPRALSHDKGLELQKLAGSVKQRLRDLEDGRGEVGAKFLKRWA
jgi:hypothetical protein